MSSSGGSPAPSASHHSATGRSVSTPRCYGRAVPADMTPLLDDLRAEHADLDALVAGADLATATPADGWTVADTVGHLWFFDREATKAIVAPDEFAEGVQTLLADVDAAMAAALD